MTADELLDIRAKEHKRTLEALDALDIASRDFALAMAEALSDLGAPLPQPALTDLLRALEQSEGVLRGEVSGRGEEGERL